MTMPNFLVIGPAKCGTTSLHAYLAQHPQVFMSPRKEPHFFEFGEIEESPLEFKPRPAAVQTLAAYQALFAGAASGKAIGEASPSNFHARACRRIRHCLPDAKFICVLRHPVDRQYSAFLTRRLQGTEPIADFAAACHDGRRHSEQRQRLGLEAYRGAAWYVERLQDWFTRFERRQLHVALFDNLKADPVGLMRQLYGFLEVNDPFLPDVSRIHNQASVLRSPALHRFLRSDSLLKRLVRQVTSQGARRRTSRWLRQWNHAPPPPLPPDLRRELTAAQDDDIVRLQDLIGRDLSAWRAEPG